MCYYETLRKESWKLLEESWFLNAEQNAINMKEKSCKRYFRHPHWLQHWLTHTFHTHTAVLFLHHLAHPIAMPATIYPQQKRNPLTTSISHCLYSLFAFFPFIYLPCRRSNWTNWWRLYVVPVPILSVASFPMNWRNPVSVVLLLTNTQEFQKVDLKRTFTRRRRSKNLIGKCPRVLWNGVKKTLVF